MRVLLINPPVRDFYNTPLRRLPLGLLYIAAALRREGHEVSLLDAGAMREDHACEPPGSAEDPDLAAFAGDTTPFRLFGRFRHFGPTYDRIEELVAEAAPEAVGISALFTPYAAEAMETAAAAKRAAPGSPVILGGGHPSAFPRAVLEHPAVDHVIVGEGELAFPRLVAALAAGRDAARNPGAVRVLVGRAAVEPPLFVQDLDDLPLPDRELADPSAYTWRGKPMTQILSSRGCPVGCAFCSAHLTAGRRFRPRAPEAVVAEMRHCRDTFGTEVFDFEDDNLTLDRGRALHLMELIRDSFGERALRLEALNGLSLKQLDRPMLGALVAAGFERLHLAPLSIEARSLAAMKRQDRSIEDFIRTAGLANEAGMRVTAYVMIGYPGQTVREVMATIEAIARAGHRVTPSVFYPAAGSEIQRDLMPRLDSAGAGAWGGLRSACFPTIPGGLSRPVLRTLYWMAHLADFAGSLFPERTREKLQAACASTAAAAAMGAPHPAGQPWTVRSRRRLDASERGLEAIGAYLRTHHPHGVRVLRRGRNGKAWKYAVFPLPGLLEDRAFYRRWGVPGFGPP